MEESWLIGIFAVLALATSYIAVLYLLEVLYNHVV